MADRSEIMSRIVIAGGTGFLGLNLARYLSRFKWAEEKVTATKFDGGRMDG
jgi:nucleoside-diphosphate-sugar epimerase